MARDKSAFLSSFGRRLKEARKASGMSQVELAPLIGLAKDSVSRYERGEVSPNAELVMLLAVSLGVSADWLLTGEGEMRRTRQGVMPNLDESERCWLGWLRDLDDEQRSHLAKLIEHLVCFNRLRHLDDGVDEPEASSAEAGETEPPLDLSAPPWMTAPPRPEPEINILLYEPPKRPR